MAVDISDYVNVKERALELGCNILTGLSILPRNFETATKGDVLIYESSVLTIKKLIEREGLEVTCIVESGEEIVYRVEKSFDWIGPILLFTAVELSKNPEIVAISIGVISEYLADFFKGKMFSGKVKLNVVVERVGGEIYKKITYEGNVEGLKEIQKIVEKVTSDE